MFYQYADRIELLNSGGLYGRVNREKFPDENAAKCAEKGAERTEKVKAWALNMIPSGVRQDARSNMAPVLAGIGVDEKITTEGLMRLTGFQIEAFGKLFLH